MKPLCALVVAPVLVLVMALAAALPTAALAGRVCPPASLDEPLPGVSEATLIQASVSTARFPGQWQEGEFGGAGLSYRLYADGSGTVSDDLRLRGWHVDFTCDLSAKHCTFATVAAVPAKALEAARAIGACLTATPPRSRERPQQLAAATKTAPSAPQHPAARPSAADANLPAAPARGTAAPNASTPRTPAQPAPHPTVSPKAPTASPAGTTAKPAAPRPTATKTAPSAPQQPAAMPTRPASAAPIPAASHIPTQSANPPACRAALTATGGLSLPPAPALCRSRLTAFLPPPPPCWADRLPEEPAPARLQRLLLLAGFDAGPVDGHPGRRTRAALVRALGTDRAAAPEADQIAALRALLCEPPHAG